MLHGWPQTLSSASVGTFLTALGIDLIIRKQTGMSMGLRYLFDRNSAHTEVCDL